MATALFRHATGYKRLNVYILTNLIQLETLVFCRRAVAPKGRRDPRRGWSAKRETPGKAATVTSREPATVVHGGGEMRLRHGTRGDFRGCTNYPACKGTRDMTKEGL